jgi:enterochelin esterase-like enzyme
MPPVITAAIDHAGERRIAEFTPTQGGKPEAGRARDYARLVFNEILPGLAADLPIKTDAAGLTMGGSSMGGLITLWLAAMHPGRFGRLIVMSPSVWWDDRVILRTLKSKPLEPPPRVWLDCGKREGPTVLKDTRALRDVLRGNPHLHLKYVEDEHGDHSEVAWGGRLADALAWIYGAELPLSARLRPRSDAPSLPERRSTPRLGRR